MTRVAVVTIAHGRQAHLDNQHVSLAAGSRLPDDYLVVSMADPGIGPRTVGALTRRVEHVPAGPGGALPLAAARNHGVAVALDAGAEVVVLLDVDCLAGGDLVAAYTDVVGSRPGWIWSGPVTYLPPPPAGGYPAADPAALAALDAPHPARPAPAPGELLHSEDPHLFWSLSFAVAPATWRRVGGFCEEYVGYGGEDTDLALTAVASGVGLGWVGAARAYHQHHPVSSPPVEHVDDILRNGRLHRHRWGYWPMTGWLEAFEAQGIVRRHGEDWVRADRPAGQTPRTQEHTP